VDGQDATSRRPYLTMPNVNMRQLAEHQVQLGQQFLLADLHRIADSHRHSQDWWRLPASRRKSHGELWCRTSTYGGWHHSRQCDSKVQSARSTSIQTHPTLRPDEMGLWHRRPGLPREPVTDVQTNKTGLLPQHVKTKRKLQKWLYDFLSQKYSDVVLEDIKEMSWLQHKDCA